MINDNDIIIINDNMMWNNINDNNIINDEMIKY